MVWLRNKKIIFVTHSYLKVCVIISRGVVYQFKGLVISFVSCFAIIIHRKRESWPLGYKTFFMLKSTEHEILTACK